MKNTWLQTYPPASSDDATSKPSWFNAERISCRGSVDRYSEGADGTMVPLRTHPAASATSAASQLRATVSRQIEVTRATPRQMQISGCSAARSSATRADAVSYSVGNVWAWSTYP